MPVVAAFANRPLELDWSLYDLNLCIIILIYTKSNPLEGNGGGGGGEGGGVGLGLGGCI